MSPDREHRHPNQFSEPYNVLVVLSQGLDGMSTLTAHGSDYLRMIKKVHRQLRAVGRMAKKRERHNNGDKEPIETECSPDNIVVITDDGVAMEKFFCRLEKTVAMRQFYKK